MKHDRIRDSLDTCLREVTVSPALHNELRRKAMAPATVCRPAPARRLIAAIALVLMLLATTAAALTIAELVRSQMEPVKQIELDDRSHAWDQEEKLAIIELMQDWGFELDPEKLARLEDPLSPEEAELLTYEIIWDCIGERLQAYWRSQGLPTDQPEEFPMSSRTYALYEALWLMNDPSADPAAIRASYAEWEAALHAENPETPTATLKGQDFGPLQASAKAQEPPEDDLARAALAQTVDGYMADVMSMSTRERKAASWTAALNGDGTAWQVVIHVKGSLLREETRAWFHRQYLIGNTDYDPETDCYDYPYVFTAEGRSGDAATLEEYEWNRLIPREAWPEMPAAYADYPYFDPLKCFLYASAAEKAAFSQAWKPVVDTWLREHPAFEAKLIAAPGNHPQYRITRHRYGTPPEGYLQEDKALHLSILHAITLRPDVSFNQLMNRCHHILFYDVCDPEHPLWKVMITWDAERALPDDPMVDFLTVINPETGEIIADQRSLALNDANQW